MLNYKCRFGEIDIVGIDDTTLVFYEVKWRRNIRFGTSAAQVDRGKQGLILKAAEHFLQTQPLIAYHGLRFDVLALGQENRWIKSAFSKEDLIPDSGLAR